MLRRSRAVVLSLGLGIASLGAVGGIAIAADDQGERPATSGAPQLQSVQEFIDRQAEADRKRVAEAERVGPRELAGLSDDEALRALRKHLAGLVGRKVTAQLDAKKGERVKRYIGGGSQALVQEEGGQRRKQLVQSTLPLRVPTTDAADAPLEPLSTQVEARGENVAAENAPSRYRIARRLGAGSALPEDAGTWFTESKFGVVPLADGQALGGDGATLSGDKAIVPNAARDLDYVTAATAGGSQGMFVLRSGRSSTRLAMRIVGDVDEVREGEHRLGAEVVRGKTVIGRLQAPIAADANGTPVQVDWRLVGREMRISVDLDDPAIQFPVVVDPSLVEDQRYWVSGTPADRAGWEFATNAPAGFYPSVNGQGYYGFGLTIYSTTANTYPNGTWGEWFFRAPGDPAHIDEAAHITNVDFGYVAHAPAGGTGSCMQEGIYDPRNTSLPAGAFESAWWKNSTATDTTAGPYTQYGGAFGRRNCAAEGQAWNPVTYSQRSHGMTQPFGWGGSDPMSGRPGNLAVFGLSNGIGKPTSNGLAFLGSSIIRMSEQVAPHVSATGQPAGWVDAGPTFTATSTDYGLGSVSLQATATGMATQSATTPACMSTALNPRDDRGTPTTGNQGDRNNRCPQTLSTQVNSAALPEGANTVTLTGKDLMDNQATLAVPVKVDKSKPTIEQLNPGQVVRPAAPAGSSAPTKISVKAKDQYSGVKTVTVKVDGQPVTVTQPTCTATQCPTEHQFDISADGLSAGKHRVEVTVVDLVGGASHTATQAFDVAVMYDAGATPPSDVSRTPERGLGFEDWMTYDTTATGAGSNLRVNLATGNALWSVTPVSNPGVGLDTVMRLTYNSLEPSGLLPALLKGGAFGYGVAGRGFSLQLGSITRVNEPLWIQNDLGVPLGDLAAGAGAKRITLTDGDGTRQVFERDSSKAGVRFTPPAGVELELRRYSTTDSDRRWAATRPDGTTFFFDAEGYPSWTEDRHHNKLHLEYETQVGLAGCGFTPICTKRLKRVVDAAGLSATDLSNIPATAADDRAWTLTYDDQSGPSDSDFNPNLLVAVRDRKLIGGQRRVTKLGYDGNQRLTSLTVAENAPVAEQRRSWSFGYLQLTSPIPVETGYLNRITDPRGHDTDVAYATTADPIQSVLESLLGALGLYENRQKVVSVDDRSSSSGSRRTTYSFDAPAGGTRVTRVRDARGHVDRIAMDDAGRMTELTQGVDDPATSGTNEAAAAPRKTVQAWTDDNYVDYVTVGANEPAKAVTTDYSWGSLGQLQQQVQHAGDHAASGGQARERFWGYQTHSGTITGTGDPADTANHDTDYSFVYDLTSETRWFPLGTNPGDRGPRTTSYGYGATPNVGDVRTIDRPARGHEEFDFNGRGLMTAHRTRLWGSASDRGSLNADEGEATVVSESWSTFDGNGSPQKRVDARGKEWRTFRDEVGNVRLLADPRSDPAYAPASADPPFKEAVAAASGDPVAAVGGTPQIEARYSGPKFVARWSYDALDRQVTQAIPKRSSLPETAGNDRFRVSATTYDQNDNPTKQRDAEGHVSEAIYTATDRVTEERSDAVAHYDPGSSDAQPGTAAATQEITRYRYDPVDNLELRSDPLGSPTSAGHRTRWAYNEFDEATVQTRDAATPGPDGQAAITTSRAYDVRGNVVAEADAKTNSDASMQDAEANARDSALQRQLYVYDAFDRLTDATENPVKSGTETDDTVGLNTHYGYDENDLRDTTTPAGRKTSYEYDDAGQLSRRKDPFSAPGAGTVVTADTTYERRDDGTPYAITAPRGNDGGGADGFVTRLAYWQTGELKARELPRRTDQYGSPIVVRYTQLSDVGDPLTVVDGRGKPFTNEFLDTGELAKTTRPSWWIYDQASSAVRERTSDDPAPSTQTAGDLPSTDGKGDFGDVKPQDLPDVLPRAGETSLGYDDELRLNRVSSQDDKTPAANEPEEFITQTLSYDAVGRLVGRDVPYKSGAPDLQMQWQYDAVGNVRATIDPAGQRTISDYDEYDRLVSQSSPANCDPSKPGCVRPVTKQAYDRNGNVLRQELPSKDDAYDTDKGGTSTGTVVTTFDAVDRPVDTVDASGSKTTQRYDKDGLVVKTIRPQAYVGTGRDPDDYATTYTRDGGGRVIKEEAKATDRDGATSTPQTLVTDSTYDRNGNLTRVEAPGAADSPTGGVARQVQVREYDGRDLPWTTTVGDGSDAHTTVTEYDGNGWLRRTVKPKGVDSNKRPLEPDAPGFPRDGQQARNAEVLEYDDEGLLKARNLPWGAGDADQNASNRVRWRQRYDYTGRGLLKRVVGIYDDKTGDPGAPGAEHDTLIQHNDAGWITDTTTNDLQGNGPSIHMEFKYDRQGNQTEWNAPNGLRSVNTTFWPSGQMRARCGLRRTPSDTVTEEQIYSYRYDRSGALRQMTDWSHHSPENLTGQCEEKAQADSDPDEANLDKRRTSILRDRAGRPVKVDEEWSSGKDTVYDYVDKTPNLIASVKTDGRLVADSQDPDDLDLATYTNGTRTTYGYDELDRNTAVSVWTDGDDSGAADRTTSLRYWPSGAQRQVVKPKTTAAGDHHTVESRYYDTAGLIRKRQVDPASGSTRTTTYAYDENGNRTNDERGIEHYNARDQLTKWERRKQDGGMPAQTEKDPGKTVTYGLDGSGRQRSATQEIWIDSEADDVGGAATDYGVVKTEVETSNDFVGDRLTRSRQTITVPSSSKTPPGGTLPDPAYQTDCYAYDPMGSQTAALRKKQTSAGDLTGSAGDCPANLTPTTSWRLESQNTYDTFERMVATRKRDHADDDPHGTGSGTLQKNQVICYDGLDRRDRRLTGLDSSQDPGEGDDNTTAFQKARAACAQQASSADLKVFDYSYLGLGQQLTREKETDGKAKTYEYTSTGQRLGQLSRPSSGSPSWRSYDTDAQGSVVGLESPSTGDVDTDDRYDSDPYGALVKPEKGLSDDAKDNPFRYQGFYVDAATGVYDMQARAYDAGLGQFLQQDRYQDPGGDLELAVDPLTSSRYAFTAGNPSTRGEWDGHQTIGIQTGQVDPSWLKSHNYYKSNPAQYQRSVQAQTRWGQTTTRMVQTRQLPQMPVPKPDPAKAADAGSAALNWLKGAAGDVKSFLQDNFTCGQFVNAGDSQCSQRFSSVREPINNGLQAFDETSVALGPLAPELLGLSRGIGFFATGRSLLGPVEGASTAAAKGGEETTRVGRWMSEVELKKMRDSGRVVEGAGGRTYVTRPPDPAAFPAGKGVFAEFDVFSGSLHPASKPEWAVIPGPNAGTTRFGPLPKEMPEARCIEVTCRR